MVLRPTLKLVTTQTSVTGEENGGKQLPPIELLSQLKNTYILPATPKSSAHNSFGLWVLWYLCLCDPGLLSILHSEVGRGFKTHNLIDIKAEVEFKYWTYPLTHEMTKLPIRWELGSLNKQNKKFEQNCIFERAGRGTIPAQRWEKCRK